MNANLSFYEPTDTMNATLSFYDQGGKIVQRSREESRLFYERKFIAAN